MRAFLAAIDNLQVWSLAAAAIEGMVAAGREGATDDRLRERRHKARDFLEPLGTRAGSSARDGGHQPARVGMGWTVKQLQD